ncbi:MAG: hypothetical protein DRG78_07845 [Epsilonproteobacteria bacterium]|nr:MAG: hypothetical protein DRG78_07845 [Campylobacterota bacterium]
MIHGFNVQASGTVFTAVPTKAIDRTDDEMSEEKIFSSDKSTKSNDSSQTDVNNISYQTSRKLANSSMVAFTDQSNGKYVVLSLQKDTINMLQSHFGDDDFYKRDDGMIRLDNRAESYVSGWFADIAYKREFIKADSNSDGILDDKEYKNTRNDFNVKGGISDDNKSLYEEITNQYSLVSEGMYVNYREFNNPSNIDDELNATLLKNKDFNNTLTLEEAYNTKDDDKNYENVIFKHANEMIPQALKDAMFEEKMRQLEEQISKKVNALSKLLYSKGDVSQLSPLEKLLLEDELSIVKNGASDMQKVMNDKLDEMLKVEKYMEYK